jgi:hypothetical protein
MNTRMSFFIAAAVVLALTACPATSLFPGAGPSKFTGEFMADTGPDELVFLSLTQTGNEVSGYYIYVNCTKEGYSSSVSAHGVVDGDSITLNFGGELGFFITATGSKIGNKIILTFPSASGTGTVVTLTFIPSSRDAFNHAVAVCRDEVEQQQQSIRATEQAVRATEEAQAQATQIAIAGKEKVKELASKLYDSIEVIKQSTQRIKDGLDDVKDALSEEQSVIETMRAHLEEEKQHASVRPMTCYQANAVVAHDYNATLKHDYDASLSYFRNIFASVLKKLESELFKVEANERTARNIARDLKQIMRTATYPLPDLTSCEWWTCYSRPGDEEGPIADYLAAAATALKELPALKAADADVLKTADGIMAEGKSVLDAVQAMPCVP